jgi:8-amino-7-oxononanoate synthase
MKALRIVEEEPHRRERLMGMAAQLRDQLRELGWSTGHSASQIIPVIVGSASQALELARRLQTRGLFVPCIRPPSVPPGESVLRISLSYSHRDDMVQALLDALGAAA